MPSMYDQTRMDAIVADMENDRFLDHTGTFLGKRYNAHHVSSPAEIGSLAVFQQIIQPALIEEGTMTTAQLMSYATQKDTAPELLNHVWQSLRVLDNAKLINTKNVSADEYYTLTLRGKELTFPVDLYTRDRSTSAGCLGSLAAGSISVLGMSKAGIPLYLSIGAFGAGGMAASKIALIRGAIDAQASYASKTAGQ